MKTEMAKIMKAESAPDKTSGDVRLIMRRAFTLVELLIVIAIIAILAGFIFPITKAVNRTKLRSRAKAELAQMENAIESYKSKLGFYPPDAYGNFAVHQLYYELGGTVLASTNAGGATADTFFSLLKPTELGGFIQASQVQVCFTSPTGPLNPLGKRVTGFMNSGRPGGGDEARGAINLIKGIKENQVATVQSAAAGTSMRVLACTVPWPANQTGSVFNDKPIANPWRYNSSMPTNNPGSFDLWVDIMVDGRTNRVSNWSKEPQVL